jgi:hypothetical protein
MKAFLAARASPTPRRAELLLPFATVQSYLVEHPLVRGTNLAPSDVHQAIIDWHAYSQAADASSPASPACTGAAPRCGECGDGHLVIDAREGCVVCDRCGLVSRGSINVEPEWMPPPAVATVVGGPAMRRALATEAPVVSLRADLENCNAYTRLAEHTVAALVPRLDAWVTHHSTLLRVVAALLHVTLHTAAPAEEEVRRATRTSRSTLQPAHKLSPIVSTAPPTRFSCASCGRGCHDLRTARYHCRPYGVKRRRR